MYSQPEGNELEALRNELQRYKLELANREDNYNRVFAQFRPVHVDGGATLRVATLPPPAAPPPPAGISSRGIALTDAQWARGPGSAAPLPPPPSLGRRALTMVDTRPAQSRRQNLKISDSISALEVGHGTEDNQRSENFRNREKRVRIQYNIQY